MGWLWHALAIAGSMTWEILWALILGFLLSAIVQSVVRRETVSRALGSDRPAALAARGRRAPPRRPGHRRLDGGPRGDGHVRDRGGFVLAPAHVGPWVHGGVAHLRDGVGGDLAGYRGRAADHRGAGGVGTDGVLA